MSFHPLRVYMWVTSDGRPLIPTYALDEKDCETLARRMYGRVPDLLEGGRAVRVVVEEDNEKKEGA